MTISVERLGEMFRDALDKNIGVAQEFDVTIGELRTIIEFCLTFPGYRLMTPADMREGAEILFISKGDMPSLDLVVWDTRIEKKEGDYYFYPLGFGKNPIFGRVTLEYIAKNNTSEALTRKYMFGSIFLVKK